MPSTARFGHSCWRPRVQVKKGLTFTGGALPLCTGIRPRIQSTLSSARAVFIDSAVTRFGATFGRKPSHDGLDGRRVPTYGAQPTATPRPRRVRGGIGDFAPYWVYPGDAKIERHLLPYPLSRNLQKVLRTSSKTDLRCTAWRSGNLTRRFFWRYSDSCVLIAMRFLRRPSTCDQEELDASDLTRRLSRRDRLRCTPRRLLLRQQAATGPATAN